MRMSTLACDQSPQSYHPWGFLLTRNYFCYLSNFHYMLYEACDIILYLFSDNPEMLSLYSYRYVFILQMRLWEIVCLIQSTQLVSSLTRIRIQNSGLSDSSIPVLFHESHCLKKSLSLSCTHVHTHTRTHTYTYTSIFLVKMSCCTWQC